MPPVPGPSGNPARQAVNYRGAHVPGTGKKRSSRRSSRKSGRK